MLEVLEVYTIDSTVSIRELSFSSASAVGGEIKLSRRLPVVSTGRICMMIFENLSHSVMNVRG